MSELCKWLHEQLEQLPMIRYPFELERLPKSGIYFFYEKGEIWRHGGVKPRIVRIGTHSGEGNFRSRMGEHFLLDESRMNFDKDKPKPSDRSVFRKNIGRALLNRDSDPYLQVWEKDFTPRKNKELFSHLRDIEKEKAIEAEITRILRENFTFRFIALENPSDVGRIKELESPHRDGSGLRALQAIRPVARKTLPQTENKRERAVTGATPQSQSRHGRTQEDHSKRSKNNARTLLTPQLLTQRRKSHGGIDRL
ncbi:MAG: hypothetical protein QXK88_01560 [Desulfurococcaceae archaeon]